MSDFISTKSNKFIKENKLDSDYFENIRFVLDSFAIHHPNELIPSVQGGFWRRYIDGENFKDMGGDIDFYWSCKNGMTSNMVFSHYVYENFNLSEKEIDFLSINFTKNLLIETHTLREKTLSFQIMGGYFNTYSDTNKQAIINSLDKMDSYVNMIGYDFYSDSFVYHKDAIQCIKDKHYKVNTNEDQLNPFNLMKRMVKFSKFGYEISDEDYKNAATVMKNTKRPLKNNYSEETIDTSTDFKVENCLNTFTGFK